MISNTFLFQLIQLNQMESGLDAERGKTSLAVEGQVWSSSAGDYGDIDTFCNEYGFYQDSVGERLMQEPEYQNTALRQHQPRSLSSDTLRLGQQDVSDMDNIHLIEKDKEEKGLSLSLSSLDLLRDHSTWHQNLNKDKASATQEGTSACSKKLSTKEIMRLAGERFIQFASHKFININILMQPYSSNISGLSGDDKEDVQLVQLLFTVAEKVFYQQLDRACKLLPNCKRLASNTGTPVQRAVYYFAQALEKRIERETGRIISATIEKKPEDPTIRKLKRKNAFIEWYQKLPFHQVMQFVEIQAMVEKIKPKSKVHLIDFSMRTGLPWAVLMQAVAKQETCTIEQLKLTVVETIDKEGTEAACKHLQNVAGTLDLKFSYHIILLSDMKDITEEQFKVEPEEVIMVHASFVLCTMISRPICLETIMNVMKRLHPSVLVVTEVEGNHNSPSFVNRFIEAFFHYGAIFDCLEDCMERNDPNRIYLEAGIHNDELQNIVASEGSERATRAVKFEVWRAFFERFGMVETELSQSALYQAHLVLQKFPNRKSCTLESNWGRLTVGWKGTPLFTISTWRFG